MDPISHIAKLNIPTPVSMQTSLIYGLLVLVWGVILGLYVVKFVKIRPYNKTIAMLIFILAIDALRTFFESIYFGIYFSQPFAFIANSLIFQPSFFIFPKLVNLAAALLIVFLLIKHLLPRLVVNETTLKEQLKDSELKLNVAVKYSPNPILIHTEDGEILSVSDTLLELTGYARKDIKNIKDWLDKAYQSNAEVMHTKILRSFKTNDTYNLGEVLIHGNNNQALYWHMNSIALGSLDDGRKVRMTTALDVTDNRMLLNRLYLIEHSINKINDSVIWLSEEGNIIAHNDYVEKQLGYSPVELANLTLDNLSLTIKTTWEDLWRNLSICNHIDFNSTVTTKNGQFIPVAISAHYVEFNNQQYVFMIMHDISAKLLAEQSILESEEKRKFALDAANIGDWDMDIISNSSRRSLIHDQCFGYDEPVEDWGYDTFISHIHPLDRERVESVYQYAMQGGADYDVEFRVIWPDKSLHWLWSKGRFFFDVNSRPIRVSGIQIDITQRKQAELALLLNKSAIEASTSGVVIVDADQPDNPMIYVNPAFEEMTGYKESEVLGKNCRFLSDSVRDEEKLTLLKAALNNHQPIELEILNKRKDGIEFWHHLKISPIRNEVGKVTHFVGIQNDITKRKLAQAESEALNEKVKRLAYSDSLTGLPNRAALGEHLEEIKSTEQMKMAYVVLLMDVDNFKNINDAFGHYIGDIFIKMLVERLKALIEVDGFMCRFGGDEFVLVMTDKRNNAEALFNRAKLLANKIVSAMKLPFNLNNFETFSSMSIGLNFINADLNIISAIKQADLAMYKAKKEGKNNVQIFDENLEKIVLDKSNLEGLLRKAVNNEAFELYYQPQIKADNQIFGCEALIRWQSDDLGRFVSPGEFIPLAEETSLMLPIGRWVLETACATLQRWSQVDAFKDITLSVNISAIQFKNEGFVFRLAEMLETYSFKRKNLKLELTETMLAEDVNAMIAIMNEIRKLGLTISLDDFGTGYSSLSYLKAFPINQLKIDQSFVRDILIDSNDALIAEAIIKLSNTLGLETVAEGVETEEQRQCLIELGCTQFQGYLFSKAICLEEVESFMNNFNR